MLGDLIADMTVPEALRVFVVRKSLIMVFTKVCGLLLQYAKAISTLGDICFPMDGNTDSIGKIGLGRKNYFK